MSNVYENLHFSNCIICRFRNDGAKFCIRTTNSTAAGGQLTDFEDANEAGKIVRLQHPLGVAVAEKEMFIADTYNHKLRSLNLSKQTIKSFTGDGKSGSEDDKRARFYEPGGLSAAGNKLYVADTNNHSIRIVDLKMGQVSTLKISGLQPPNPQR